MTLLVAGVLLWSFAHLFKRIAPRIRASLGMAGKGLVAIAVLLSVWMMVTGYSSVENIFYWGRNPALAGINNLLMLFAVYLMVISLVATALRRKIRNPQLTAVKVWALAHLLVNGDLASFVLFGGLLAWAVVSVILIKRQEGISNVQIQSTKVKEALALLATLLAYGGIALIHLKLGYPVFG